MDSLSKIYDGASVALVGGVDAFDARILDVDVVVRVNGHWQKQRGKCDVLYWSSASDLPWNIFDDEELWWTLRHVAFSFSPALFSEASITHINAARRKCEAHGVSWSRYFHAPAEAWQVFSRLQDAPTSECFCKELSERYSFHPLTGAIALHHILMHSPRSVYVTNMNLYAKNGALPEEVGRHKTEPNRAFFLDASRDERVTYSEEFEDSLRLAIR